MARGLAIPYEQFSIFGVGNYPALEIISRGALSRAVESGRSSRTGKPIFACWGHRREGRKRSEWKIADTASGNLRLFETDLGVEFEIDGLRLPLPFTGVSVQLEPMQWQRESPMTRRLIEGGIAHIALLEVPNSAAYVQTFIETVRRSM